MRFISSDLSQAIKASFEQKKRRMGNINSDANGSVDPCSILCICVLLYQSLQQGLDKLTTNNPALMWEARSMHIHTHIKLDGNSL